MRASKSSRKKNKPTAAKTNPFESRITEINQKARSKEQADKVAAITEAGTLIEQLSESNDLVIKRLQPIISATAKNITLDVLKKDFWKNLPRFTRIMVLANSTDIKDNYQAAITAATLLLQVASPSTAQLLNQIISKILTKLQTQEPSLIEDISTLPTFLRITLIKNRLAPTEEKTQDIISILKELDEFMHSTIKKGAFDILSNLMSSTAKLLPSDLASSDPLSWSQLSPFVQIQIAFNADNFQFDSLNAAATLLETAPIGVAEKLTQMISSKIKQYYEQLNLNDSTITWHSLVQAQYLTQSNDQANQLRALNLLGELMGSVSIAAAEQLHRFISHIMQNIKHNVLMKKREQCCELIQALILADDKKTTHLLQSLQIMSRLLEQLHVGAADQLSRVISGVTKRLKELTEEEQAQLPPIAQAQWLANQRDLQIQLQAILILEQLLKTTPQASKQLMHFMRGLINRLDLTCLVSNYEHHSAIIQAVILSTSNDPNTIASALDRTILALTTDSNNDSSIMALDELINLTIVHLYKKYPLTEELVLPELIQCKIKLLGTINEAGKVGVLCSLDELMQDSNQPSTYLYWLINQILASVNYDLSLRTRYQLPNMSKWIITANRIGSYNELCILYTDIKDCVYQKTTPIEIKQQLVKLIMFIKNRISSEFKKDTGEIDQLLQTIQQFMSEWVTKSPQEKKPSTPISTFGENRRFVIFQLPAKSEKEEMSSESEDESLVYNM